MSDAGDGDDVEEVGYKHPPKSTRFRKGQSGNRKGRPRNRHREIPYDALLGQKVTIREDGCEHQVTAAEAFLLHLTQKGLAGDGPAGRASLGAMEEARSKRVDDEFAGPLQIHIVGMEIGVVTDSLGLTVKKYATNETRVRREIQPWIVEAALARLGDRRFTEEEQREVWKNTRTPHKVAWPEWWTFRS